jgi:hypothetical protein
MHQHEISETEFLEALEWACRTVALKRRNGRTREEIIEFKHELLPGTLRRLQRFRPGSKTLKEFAYLSACFAAHDLYKKSKNDDDVLLHHAISGDAPGGLNEDGKPCPLLALLPAPQSGEETEGGGTMPAAPPQKNIPDPDFLHSEIAEFLACLRLSSYAVKMYAGHLKRFARFCETIGKAEIAALDRESVQDFIHKSRYGPEYVLRKFLNHLLVKGLPLDRAALPPARHNYSSNLLFLREISEFAAQASAGKPPSKLYNIRCTLRKFMIFCEENGVRAGQEINLCHIQAFVKGKSYRSAALRPFFLFLLARGVSLQPAVIKFAEAFRGSVVNAPKVA